MSNKGIIFIAYDDYNGNVGDASYVNSIRPTCSRNALRNAIKVIEIKIINIKESHD